MIETAERVALLMKTLSHPKRLLILCNLVEGERSVGDLARLTAMRETAVSQQLALLRREGLVATRREAQSILYRLDRPDVASLLGFLYATYCADPLAGPSSAAVEHVTLAMKEPSR